MSEGRSVKKQFVRDLVVDGPVDSVFRVITCDVRTSRSGARFLSLSLADRTGRIAAKRWDLPDVETESGRGVRYARIRGVVEDYRGYRQIRIDFPIEDAGDVFDPADYEPHAPLRLTDLRTRFNRLASGVEDTALRDILRVVFGDTQFRTRFETAPAASSMHHACRHGLLQHTVEVAEVALAVANLQRTWGYEPVSRDLVVAAALLHDIGKVEELDWSDASYVYTVRGGLLGHVAIGYGLVRDAARRIPGFTDTLCDALLHIILSHHGKLEHGSPVAPMLREAAIVHEADEISARLYCMTDAAADAGEKDFGWHRAVEGNRVYAGPLGLTDRSEPAQSPSLKGGEPANGEAEFAPAEGAQSRPEPALAPSVEPTGTPQQTLDMISPAAAILRGIDPDERMRRSRGRFPR
ncbi:MAG: 3'-5' exoribonuclease YhaM family protein [Capsulimonadaceae bacterium]